jgi:hypothetical protein
LRRSVPRVEEMNRRGEFPVDLVLSRSWGGVDQSLRSRRERWGARHLIADQPRSRRHSSC